MELTALLKAARINQKKLIHQSMEMRLVGACSLFDICQILVHEYPQQFDLHAVNITFLDPMRQMEACLREQQREDDRGSFDELMKSIKLVHDYKTIKWLRSVPRVADTAAFDRSHALFFNDAVVNDLKSVAILPLVRGRELLGFLSLGSVDSARYRPDMTNSFIDRLASITALCVQNAVHLENTELTGLSDPLTQAHNQRYFCRRLTEEIQRAQRSGTPISCLYLDIDHLENISDEHGQMAGDMTLVCVVERVRAAVRESDVIARLDGGAFAVILPETFQEGAHSVAHRISKVLRKTPCEFESDGRVKITASIGLSSYDTDDVIAEPEVLADKLIDRADKALYQAKHRGRDCVVAYRPVA